MRRFFVLLLFLAMAMTLIVASPAGAEKPQCDSTVLDPPYTPDHSACNKDDPPDETSLNGTVCDPADYPADLKDLDGNPTVGVQVSDFTFTLSGKQDGACIDVISGEGVWTVTIEGDGARYLGVIPRDSIAPGDSCGGYLLRSHAIYGSNPLTLGYDGVIPEATINACGVDFDEWVNLADYPLAAPHCSAFNGTWCEVTEQVPVTHPLVLQTFLRGSADGVTTFTVDFPELGVP